MGFPAAFNFYNTDICHAKKYNCICPTFTVHNFCLFLREKESPVKVTDEMAILCTI